jgi:hypothetical protein
MRSTTNDACTNQRRSSIKSVPIFVKQNVAKPNPRLFLLGEKIAWPVTEQSIKEQHSMSLSDYFTICKKKCCNGHVQLILFAAAQKKEV